MDTISFTRSNHGTLLDLEAREAVEKQHDLARASLRCAVGEIVDAETFAGDRQTFDLAKISLDVARLHLNSARVAYSFAVAVGSRAPEFEREHDRAEERGLAVASKLGTPAPVAGA